VAKGGGGKNWDALGGRVGEKEGVGGRVQGKGVIGRKGTLRGLPRKKSTWRAKLRWTKARQKEGNRRKREKKVSKRILFWSGWVESVEGEGVLGKDVGVSEKKNIGGKEGESKGKEVKEGKGRE